MRALALLLLALALTAAAPSASLPDIEDEVMCVVCGVVLEHAIDAPQAQQERELIRRLIAQGLTKDDEGSAQKFIDEFGLTYPQLHDGSGDYADNDLKTTGVPENFLVDPSGNVAVAIHGQLTPQLLSQQIAPRLEASWCPHVAAGPAVVRGLIGAIRTQSP